VVSVVGEVGDETYCKSGVRLQTMLAMMRMRMRESLEVVGCRLTLEVVGCRLTLGCVAL